MANQLSKTQKPWSLSTALPKLSAWVWVMAMLFSMFWANNSYAACGATSSRIFDWKRDSLTAYAAQLEVSVLYDVRTDAALNALMASAMDDHGYERCTRCRHRDNESVPLKTDLNITKTPTYMLQEANEIRARLREQGGSELFGTSDVSFFGRDLGVLERPPILA